MSPNLEALRRHEWVVNTETECIFVRHDLLEMRSPLESYRPTDQEIILGRRIKNIPIIESSAQSDPADLATSYERRSAILQAIEQMDPATFSPPIAGRPAMPKVALVKAATGMDDVTAAEIAVAMSTHAPAIALEA